MEDRPWFKFYDPGVPHTLAPYPDCTLLDVVGETVRQHPEQRLLIFKGASMTYGEVARLSDALAAALAAQGVHKGDRVATLLPNCPQMVIVQLAAWKLGCIVAPMNALYTERELEQTLNEVGATTVVVLTPFYNKVKSMQARTTLRRVIATNIKEYIPAHLRVLFTLLKEKKEGHRITLHAEDQWLGDLLRRYAGQAVKASISPQDPALLLFTGGTTGSAKAALGTHRSLYIAAAQLNAYASTVMKDWQDTAMVVVPMFHVYGNVCLLGTCLYGRYVMALVANPRDLDDLLDTIQHVHPAMFHAVPTLFNALLQHPRVKAGKIDFKSIKVCYSAAAPLLTETKRRFEELTGGWMLDGYALTESMMAAVICPIHAQYKPGSTGIPLPDVDVKIVDADTGDKRLSPDEVGEICLQAPQLMAGYWQHPEETQIALRDGWLYTGDLGYLDRDGYLFIIDRKKDLIKPGGFQVWPREVEEVVLTHPAVAEVSVAGVPDDYQGEAVKAWIVLRPGERVTVEEIHAFCKERLVGYKVPRYVEFRATLPKTMVGKVLRRELKAEKQQ
jgi:long-chain acyl-CoA synthetase